MDTGRLRDLAASYKSRAKSTENELVRKYQGDMACYLESVIAWIEARCRQEAPETIPAPPKQDGAKEACC